MREPTRRVRSPGLRMEGVYRHLITPLEEGAAPWRGHRRRPGGRAARSGILRRPAAQVLEGRSVWRWPLQKWAAATSHGRDRVLLPAGSRC